MRMEEFLMKGQEPVQPEEVLHESESAEEEVEQPAELDVQKEVVASLAADKAAQDEKIRILEANQSNLNKRVEELQKQYLKLKDENERLLAEQADLKKQIQSTVDTFVSQKDESISTRVTLLERDAEIQDRFEGETRDHVIEAIRLAREAAEKDGRIRCAQVLEGVLLANESSGNLKAHREAMEKLFADNQNIVNGPVIEELTRQGISHKHGEEYLLPSEIFKRVY